MVKRNKLQTLTVCWLVVGAAVMVTIGGVGTADAANNSNQDARSSIGSSNPATVYLGEQSLDLTNHPKADSNTLIGTAGQADGTTASIGDLSTADIVQANGFATGAYRFSGNGDDSTVHLAVRSPEVTDVTIYEGSGTDGADITGSSLPTGDTFTVEGEFNFGSAAPADVALTDDTGTEVTDAVLSSSDSWLEGSGATVTFDSTDLDSGEYTVTVAGHDEYQGNSQTDFTSASMSATITIREDDTTISLNREEVTQGEIVTGTITGSPGEVRAVQINLDDLNETIRSNGVSNAYAKSTFRSTSNVLVRDGQDRYVGAIVDLGDDGSARFQIQTRSLAQDTTATVETVIPSESGESGLGDSPDTDNDPSDGLDGTAAIGGVPENDVDLRVNEPRMDVSADQEKISQGETLTGVIVGRNAFYGVIRIPRELVADDVDIASISDGSGNDDLFRDTSERTGIGANSEYIAAEYRLEHHDHVRFEIRTEYFPKGTTVTVESVGFQNPGTIDSGDAFTDDRQDSTTFDICSEQENCFGDETSNGVAIGDLNGDGDPDIFVANTGANTVWFNDGTGSFSDSGQSLGSATSQDVKLADLDGDGDRDAFVANDGTNQVWINDGSGSFTKSDETSILGALSLDTGDIGGSRQPDVVFARDGPNSVWINDKSDQSDTSGSGDASSAEVLTRIAKSKETAASTTPERSADTSTAKAPSPSPTSTASPTATATRTETPSPSPTMSTTDTPSPTPTSSPGFGAIVTILAALASVILLRRRH